MKRTQKILALLTAGALGFSGIANALTTDTLQNLVTGNGSLTIGDKTFSNFDYTAVGLSGFSAAAIQVTASQVGDVYYLTWAGSIVAGGIINNAIVGPPPISGYIIGDLLLNYTVTASAGHIYMIDQSYTGSATAHNGAVANLNVDESVYSGVTIVAQSHLSAPFDTSDPDAEVIQGDNLNINPALTTVDVSKDIHLSIFGPNGSDGTVTLSEVRQSFHQTSVPDGGMTLVLLGAALTGIGFIRRKFSA